MLLISHRGNTLGKSDIENHPVKISEAIEQGFLCEVDVSYTGSELMLGHDEPRYVVQPWMYKSDKIIWHCKNPGAIEYCSDNNLHFFCHQKDDYALTSNGTIITFPGLPIVRNSIVVLTKYTRYTNNELSKCKGICSDNIRIFSNR